MRSILIVFTICGLVGCHPSSPAARAGDGSGAPDDPGAPDSGALDPGAADGGAGGGGDDLATGPGSTAACTTRITYGQTWMHPAQHPAQDDTASALVTWDGSCVDDGANSYATLSNGWKPYFQGHAACVLALDYASGCAQPAACRTRVTYGAAWLPPANHPTQYDDVGGRLFSDGTCRDSGANSYATLSNGWAPHFGGSGACALSFEYRGCGGLYANPVLPGGCADPGVLRDGNQYIMVCTSGNAADAFPIYVSTDLASWKAKGHIFPSAAKPTWAKSDFWAPEIHKVGAHYVAYFSARNSAGKLSIGAASAASALGPFTDRGAPLVSDPAMGLIDASEINAANGKSYLLWKEDGNAVGKPTPIHAQALAADGLSLTGAASTLITNDQSWEGAVVEGPFMIEHGGTSYLFYSGNAYYDGRYAVGVARAASPLGPFTKAAAPIVVTGGDWVGPGHCSVVDTPAGDSYMVYHAWRTGHVNGAGDSRLPLTDAVEWVDGWPALPGAPSSATRPLP